MGTEAKLIEEGAKAAQNAYSVYGLLGAFVAVIVVVFCYLAVRDYRDRRIEGAMSQTTDTVMKAFSALVDRVDTISKEDRESHRVLGVVFTDALKEIRADIRGIADQNNKLTGNAIQVMTEIKQFMISLGGRVADLEDNIDKILDKIGEPPRKRKRSTDSG